MRTILVVEDDDAIRGTIAEGLGMAGYRVLAVSTTTEVLREVKSDRPFNLAVIDVKMPPGHPHGFALGRMARLQRPDLRLLFMSGDAGVAEADGDPPGKVFLKPIRLSNLLVAVEAEFAS